MDEADGNRGDTAADNRRDPAVGPAPSDIEDGNLNVAWTAHTVEECLHKSNDVNLPGIRDTSAIVNRYCDD